MSTPFRLSIAPEVKWWYFTVNEVIWPKSLYMKEVALVFSLGCSSWVTERNVDDLSAILGVSAQD